MQPSLLLSQRQLPLRFHGLQQRARTSEKQAWGCVRLQQPPAATVIRRSDAISRCTEQHLALPWQQTLCSKQALGETYSDVRQHAEEGQCKHADIIRSSTASQSSESSPNRLLAVVALLSTAAIACWSAPAYAETSAQAVEQVAQQLTSGTSANLSKPLEKEHESG